MTRPASLSPRSITCHSKRIDSSHLQLKAPPPCSTARRQDCRRKHSRQILEVAVKVPAGDRTNRLVSTKFLEPSPFTPPLAFSIHFEAKVAYKPRNLLGRIGSAPILFLRTFLAKSAPEFAHFNGPGARRSSTRKRRASSSCRKRGETIPVIATR